jgi:hypothetical protein
MKKVGEIISFSIVLFLLVVGGIIPNLNGSVLNDLPEWVFWVATVSGVIFLILGIILHFTDFDIRK